MSPPSRRSSFGTGRPAAGSTCEAVPPWCPNSIGLPRGQTEPNQDDFEIPQLRVPTRPNTQHCGSIVRPVSSGSNPVLPKLNVELVRLRVIFAGSLPGPGSALLDRRRAPRPEPLLAFLDPLARHLGRAQLAFHEQGRRGDSIEIRLHAPGRLAALGQFDDPHGRLEG